MNKIIAITISLLFFVVGSSSILIMSANNNTTSNAEETEQTLPYSDKIAVIEQVAENTDADEQDCSDADNDLEYEEEDYYTDDDYTPTDDAYYDYGSSLTKYSGVNYYNGRTETYYSSNILYHYMTPQWNLGGDGVYRDGDGYVIVAASDLAYGSVVDTSLGVGKVYDCGCAYGVTDIYTNW